MNKNKQQAIIIDLDGTLFDTQPLWDEIQERGLELHSDEGYDFFCKYCDCLKINSWCYKICRAMASTCKIIFLSARHEKCYEKTKGELCHAFGWGSIQQNTLLVMRNGIDGDYETSDEFKRRILTTEILPKYEIAFAIDDEDNNCEMFKELKINVLKVY